MQIVRIPSESAGPKPSSGIASQPVIATSAQDILENSVNVIRGKVEILSLVIPIAVQFNTGANKPGTMRCRLSLLASGSLLWSQSQDALPTAFPNAWCGNFIFADNLSQPLEASASGGLLLQARAQVDQLFSAAIIAFCMTADAVTPDPGYLILDDGIILDDG